MRIFIKRHKMILSLVMAAFFVAMVSIVLWSVGIITDVKSAIMAVIFGTIFVSCIVAAVLVTGAIINKKTFEK